MSCNTYEEQVKDIKCDKCKNNCPINDYRKYSETKFGKT